MAGIEGALDPPTLPLRPETGGAWFLRLRNRGTEPVSGQVRLSGEAAACAWVAEPDVALAPGETKDVRISVRLPAPPTPAAGPLPLAVEIGPLRCEGTLDVLPVVDVVGSLGQADGSTWPLTVRNKGNTPARVALSADGAAVEPGWLTVAAGEIGRATVEARSRAFTVRLEPAGGSVSTVSAGAPPGVEPRERRSPRRGRRKRWPAVLMVGLAAVLVAGAVFARSGDSPSPDTEEIEGATPRSSVPDSPDCPARNHLAADPAGIPRRNVPIPDRYAFLETRPGGCLPVRWNPCEPVHYVVNSALAPRGAVDDLGPAFQQLAEVTGLEFVNDGPTQEPASTVRGNFQPDRYGNRWAPILIAWDHGERHGLQPINPGGGRPFNAGGVYASGFLILNVDAVAEDRRTPIPPGFGSGATWGRVLIHELAHLMGLGHVRSSAEIMFDDLGLQRGRAEFHTGDREGLKYLGKEAGCLTTPPVPRVTVPPRPTVPPRR